MESGRMTVVIDVDAARGIASVRNINDAVTKMGRTVEAEARRAASGIDRFVQRLNAGAEKAWAFSQKISGATISLGALTAVMSGLAYQSINLAAGLESAQIAFGVMTGSAQAAGALIKDLQQFAAKTPFEFVGLVEQGKALMAYGFEASRIIPILTDIGDAAAALGQDKLPVITRALGQIQAKGRVQAQELLQLQEAGVNAVKILADAAGKSQAEVLKFVERGMVPAQEAINALLAGMHRQFGGLMEKNSKTLRGQLSNLRDIADQTLAEVGESIGPSVKKMIGHAMPLLDWLKEAAKGFRGLPEPIRDTTVAIAGLTIALVALSASLPAIAALYGLVAGGAGKILALAGEILFLRAAATGVEGPLTLTGTRLMTLFGIIRALSVPVLVASGLWMFFKMLEDHKQTDTLNDQAAALRKLNDEIERGNHYKLKPSENGAIPVGNGQYIRGSAEVRNARQSARDSAYGGLLSGVSKLGGGAPPPGLNLGDEEAEAAKAAKARAKAIAGAEKEAAREVREAYEYQLTGLKKLTAERENALEKYRLANTLTGKVEASVTRAYQVKAVHQMNADGVKAADERLRKAMDWGAGHAPDLLEAGRYRGEINADLGARRTQEGEAGRQAEAAGIERRREAELRAVDMVAHRTVEQQLAAEGRKAEIRKRFLEEELKLELANIDRLIEADKARYRVKAWMAGMTDEETKRITDELDRIGQAEQARARDKYKADTVAVEQEVASRRADVISASTQRTFDSFKRQAEGVFDSLLRSGKGFFTNLADTMKLAFLTAIKEIVTSRVALMLTSMFGGGAGGGVRLSGGGGGGPVGILGGGGGGGLGAALGLGGLMAPAGTTPPFLPPGTATGASTGQAAGLLGGFGAQGKALLGGVKSLGNLGKYVGPGSSGGAQAGVGGYAGGAMLLGGGALAADGLRRGGMLGLAETTAGGALIGAKFGGPIGALIGGAIGAAAGTVRLFIKGATEKCKEKAKEIYGLNLDTARAKDIIAIAKQQFGGNLDMALRSPAVRDMLQLYAMSTGQSMGLNANTVRSASLVQSGGQLMQAATYENGTAIGLASSLPSMGGFSVAPGAPTTVSIQLDRQATVSVLRGEAVAAIADNPDVVMDSVSAATRSSHGRRDQAAAQISPSTLLK